MKKKMDKENNKTRVRIKTSMGDIVVRLYDETPKLRKVGKGRLF